MKRAIALLFCLPALHALAQAQAPACTPIIQGFSATKITTALCSGTQPPTVGSTMVIGVGNSQIDATVTEVTSIVGVTNVIASVVDPTAAQENLILLSGASTATLQFGSTTLTAKVQPADPLAALNRRSYNWSVGPAKAPNTNPATPTTSTENLDAIRFQAAGDYARGGVFFTNTPRETRLQSTASISIDTTDTDSTAFVDNNRVAAGIGFSNLSLGRIWMHGDAGIEAHYDKAFHSDASDFDAVLTVGGWIPVIRSFTLFSTQGDFIAAPLSFSASYGYRNRRGQGAPESGPVFEGSATYYLFLFDDYQVMFNGTWTVNDLNDRASTVPRTQKLFKVNVAYLANNRTGFYAVASFQDGSAGAMLQDIRQYFVGVGLAKLNLGGSGGSQ